MAANRADVWKLIGFIEGDMRGIAAKLTELRSMLAAGALERAPEDEVECRCGVRCAGAQALLDHLYSVHEEGALCLDCGRAKGDGHACTARSE